jgi:AcrR family transcriptional regulator
MSVVRSRSDTRAVVLVTAERLFDTRGFAAVSISDLTAASGVSNGSIYHHFASKDGVLAALIVEALAGYVRELTDALDANDDDAEGGVRAIVDHELGWFERNQRPARLVLAHRDAVAAGDAGREPMRVVNRDGLRRVLDWRDRQVDRGAIPPALDFALLHALVFAPARDVASLWLAKRIKPRPMTFATPLGDAAWAAMQSLRHQETSPR